MEIEAIAGAVEAVLFVAGDPVARETLLQGLEITQLELERALELLSSELNFQMRGLKLLCFEDKLQLCTRSEYADLVERTLRPTRTQPLTATLLETLSVIAYKQPITKAEVEEVRGVKCDYSLQALQRLGLVQEVGRKEALGRPILYGTTEDFLRHFALSSLSALPELSLAPPQEESQEDFDAPL